MSVYGADAIRVRKAIEAHGSVLWDASTAFVHDAPKPNEDGLSDVEAARRRGRLAVWQIVKAMGGIR